MKNVLPNSLILVFLLSFLYFACDSNQCEGVFCGSRQNCNPNDGNCYCVDGYEGDNCDQAANIKYVGNYFLSESCFSGSASVAPIFINQIFMQSGFNADEIQICNLLQANPSCVTALLFTDRNNQGNIIEIPTQNVGAIEVYGYGELVSATNRIQLTLSVTTNQQFYECTLTLTKTN